MSIAQMLMPEFDQEMVNTRKTLERVPADKWDWKPHPRSGTLGWLSSHVATLPQFTTVTVTTSNMEIAGSTFPRAEKHADLLPMFDQLSKEARARLGDVTDDQMREIWTLTWNGKVLLSLPRYDVLRTSCFNHLVHHRAQLTMYLRGLDVPVPALHGPSADEQS
jgi:uncharacterized damage-inducible protein DinB